MNSLLGSTVGAALGAVGDDRAAGSSYGLSSSRTTRRDGRAAGSSYGLSSSRTTRRDGRTACVGWTGFETVGLAWLDELAELGELGETAGAGTSALVTATCDTAAPGDSLGVLGTETIGAAGAFVHSTAVRHLSSRMASVWADTFQVIGAPIPRDRAATSK
jgi:hypothetical protein